MSDLDLLKQFKAWETQAFGSVFGVALSAIDLLYVPAEEFIDAFLDSWHSAYSAGRWEYTALRDGPENYDSLRYIHET